MLDTKKAAKAAANNTNTKIMKTNDSTNSAATILSGIAAELKGFSEETLSAEESYKKHLLDLSLPVDEPKYLFSIGGVPTIPEGELIGLKGRAKQGKSAFSFILIAAMLAGKERCRVKPLLPSYKILYFDTEQSRTSLRKCCQRALNFAGLPTDTNIDMFQPYFLRPLSIEERKSTIEKAIKKESPNIVFIDGIRDLLKDFNNLGESNDLIQWLLQIMTDFKCTIVVVLHQNKAKDDSSMRGHLGSEVQNKLCDSFESVKKDGKFIVSCADSRNVPCGEVSFSIDINGQFKEEAIEVEDKNSAKANEILRVLELCFKNKPQMKYGELIDAYQMEACVSERTAKNRVKEGKEHDAILVQNGLYSLRGKSV